MRNKQLIKATDFCAYHHLEQTFISELHEAGLIEINIIDQTTCIPESELHKLERLVRLHTDLDINIAGIEAISYLLQRLDNIQEEMRLLKNNLRIYE